MVWADHHTAMESGGFVGIEPERRQALQKFFVIHVKLDPCEVHADAAVRPIAKADMPLHIAGHVEFQRICEMLGIAIGR